MKVVFLLCLFLLISGCASRADSFSESNHSAQPTSTIKNVNADTNNPHSYSDYQYDRSLLDKLNAENEKFRVVPDEFKLVDFKNSKYKFGKLKDGKFEDYDPQNPLAGSQSFTLEDVFYHDLIGDNKKEAIVFLSQVNCGASCDGGADLVYFYSSNKGKIKLIDVFGTGSNSSGCSLKSFTVNKRVIQIEQFGRCDKNTSFDGVNMSVCKFCVEDETHSTYKLFNDGLKRQSVQIIDTRIINIMNSPAFISITE